ncbi:hypothetical protein CSUI_007544, partial [Cystoisospora suis]
RDLRDSAQSPTTSAGPGLLRARDLCRRSDKPEAHPYAIEAILESRQ